MSTNGSTPPGWYPDDQGNPRWWNGTAWTQDQAPVAGPSSDAQTAPPSVPSAPAARTEPVGALPIVALIFSFLAAPVGLVLGLVSIVSARRRSRRVPVLGIVATAVGALGTIVVAASVIALTLFVQTAESNARVADFCQRVSADPALTTEIRDATARYGDLLQMYPEEAAMLGEELTELSNRVSVVQGNVGGAYLRAFTAADILATYLDGLAETASERAGGSLIAPSPVQSSDIEYFEMEAADTCAG